MLPRYNSVDTLFDSFRNIMTVPTFSRARILLIGTLLTSGVRTITAALRAVGLSDEKHFASYHRVLSHAIWSSRKAAQIMLGLLVDAFVPSGPLVLGGDETLERRQGAQISKKGIYRDAARSSRSFFVKSSGLRWISLMLLAPVPFAERIWALPFLTVLAPSERYNEQHKKRHKSIVDWMMQMLTLARRWLPNRDLIFVGDSGYAALVLLDRCRKLGITAVTRLKMNAALYDVAPERFSDTKGRPRKKGQRLPTPQMHLDNPNTIWSRQHVSQWYSHGEQDIDVATGLAIWTHSGLPAVPIRWVIVRDTLAKFKPQAFLSTDPEVDPLQIIAWFVQRWRLEVTFQEVRTHLGVETQRQWSDKAIERTTPILMGLFSLVALVAHKLDLQDKTMIRQAAWYSKNSATFSDALAAVRRHLWNRMPFRISLPEPDIPKVVPTFTRQVEQALCYT